MKIQIPLPFSAKSGGTLALFELGYALHELGHEVCLKEAWLNCGFKDAWFSRKLQGARSSLGDRVRQRHRWFPYPELVQSIPYFSASSAEEYDLTILGSWPLAWIFQNADPEKLLYWLQGVEIWGGANQRVLESYHLGLPMAANSHWTAKQVEFKAGISSIPVTSLGVHARFFQSSHPERDFTGTLKILLTFHENKQRQFFDAVQILCQLRIQEIAYEVSIITPYSIADCGLGECLVINPEPEHLASVYAEHDIFLYPTGSDGWGMMLSEAMASGMIVVTNPVGFAHDFGKNEENMILPCKNTTDAYLEQLAPLFNQNQRESLKEISKQAIATVQRLTWKNTAEHILAIIENPQKSH